VYRYVFQQQGVLYLEAVCVKIAKVHELLLRFVCNLILKHQIMNRVKKWTIITIIYNCVTMVTTSMAL